MKLYQLTAHKLAVLLRKREITAKEVTESIFERINSVENKIHAYVTIAYDTAIEQAEQVDSLRQKREILSPLAGVPIVVKDNICTRGIKTTCASKMLQNFIPHYDASVISKMKANHLVLVGKTNMDEFAMGSSTETSNVGPTYNPWDLQFVPGGTSGGSAAAVAADETILALGSDTGGSIRQPASFCGVVGFKPSYGRVSRYGLIAYASSLDQIGTITKDVEDCALLMNLIAFSDPNDATTMNVPALDYTQALIANVRGMRIGIPQEYFVKGIQPEVENAVRKAINKLVELGATVIDISLPHTKYCISTYYIIATAEASANLARYDGIKYGYSGASERTTWDSVKKNRQQGFGDEVKRRIMLGTYTLSAGYYEAYYLKAQKVRTLIKQDFDAALEKCDIMVVPVAPTVAFKIGEKIHDPLQMYLGDIFTLSLNLAGLCGISVPCGFAGNLPIGMQIIGKAFAESTVLRAAYTYEQATEWHLRKPHF